MRYMCTVCGYKYEEKLEKVPFDELPKDWHCPICKAPKSKYVKS